MIFNLYIFDRSGTCVYYSEYHRPRKATLSQDEEFKLTYGMLHSIKSFVTRISPKPVREGLHYYKTSTYKLNYFETLTGLKIVLNTDPGVGDIHDLLQQIYSQIYVEYVVKNPLCTPGEKITSELFETRLNALITSLPYFAT
ncbi:trafficking protein particle complex 1 [Capsaspora owczarzaki ATCC 30864]|uniref:Trafficking protein particle complex subunit n=1 Tax=Capsaspora owczarzaki (strain ATCC 30864) TaxID=595528 RepID=A0A0D2WJI5_CAPO3|nr:trafficking protein particle complex 1 [Capsaspora owczarzaki ATCC 30864]KJE90220.1 trafficking protein particle complex 1 [Capsaspora owczarzaki ATCC 30864]|eukprot:XP_004364429.2 trafficking protein particle complex 1 [Capsaspora owczarzaki ATCC 30864]